MNNAIDASSSAKRDALLLPALFLVNCFLFSDWLELGDIPTRPWLVLVWLYGLMALVPLLWRDTAPVAVFAIECAFTVAAWPIMPQFTPVTGMPVALYAVSVHCAKRVSVLALLASFIPNGLVATVALRAYANPTERFRGFVSNIVILFIVAVWVWGMGRVARAARRRVEQLERERETVREAVVGERRRIARELHDIVSHAVTVIVLQAAGALRISDTDRDRTKQALKHIEETGKQAMAELRRMLGVLKAGDPAASSTVEGDLEPQPGLNEMTDLLNALREAGLRVTVQTEGEPHSLDPSVDLAAYRIVQEGLTNALKHAGKDSDPHLRLFWERDVLRSEVDNQAALSEVGRERGISLGVGLVGLRERAQAVGGSLRAAPDADGRYRLVATLPLVGRTPFTDGPAHATGRRPE
jgi:signal transduction histidine kinase